MRSRRLALQCAQSQQCDRGLQFRSHDRSLTWRHLSHPVLRSKAGTAFTCGSVNICLPRQAEPCLDAFFQISTSRKLHKTGECFNLTLAAENKASAETSKCVNLVWSCHVHGKARRSLDLGRVPHAGALSTIGGLDDTAWQAMRGCLLRPQTRHHTDTENPEVMAQFQHCALCGMMSGLSSHGDHSRTCTSYMNTCNRAAHARTHFSMPLPSARKSWMRNCLNKAGHLLMSQRSTQSTHGRGWPHSLSPGRHQALFTCRAVTFEAIQFPRDCANHNMQDCLQPRFAHLMYLPIHEHAAALPLPQN